MLYVVIGILVLLIIFGPQLWVKYILNKYAKPMPNMPGTGGELARHLLDRFELKMVQVEPAQAGGDHYDPQANVVRLSPNYLTQKSLTAVAVAAHEVGHAIQFNRKERVSLLRRRYLGKALLLQKAGAFILMALPIVGLIFRVPHMALLMGGAGLLTLLISVLAYVAILPEEWDASFNKALPILDEYVPEEHLPAIRRILKACAFTYIAAALADVLKLWRLWALFKGIR